MAARSVALVPVAPSAEVVVARLDDARALWFAADTSGTGDPGLTVEVDTVPGGLDVRVQAAGLARDLLLQADRVHPQAVVDRGFVTLLPGESTVFHLRAPVELDAGLIKAPWVLTDLASALRE